MKANTIVQEFLSALIAVRDEQTERTVGNFTFRPDNRAGRGFSYTRCQTLIDRLTGETTTSFGVGGMRNWPADSGMRRIAKRYAEEDATPETE